MEDDRVPTLRRRLEIEGDMTTGAGNGSRRFDDPLRDAVIVFQERNGLDPDGVVGPRTLDALNVPVERRIDQIRVNLERARWVLRDVQGDYLVTNIAGFRVYLVRDHEIVWSTRAQVGKPYRKTPVFKAELEYVVFNPTWTVPPTILRNDVLPKIKSDPDYLRQKNMVLLDRGGKIVDPAGLDWSAIGDRGFPYVVRQEPGPGNALGRVKFIFPNSHFVFLHDTPSRALFERADRTFSSGCIRVERPLELAELLLDDPGNWNREAIDAVLDSGKTRTVFLDKPIPVLLLYWTVRLDPSGEDRIGFYRDVYDRDDAVLEALREGFRYAMPAGAPEYLTRIGNHRR